VENILETKIIPKTESFLEIAHANIEPKFNYVYNLDGKLYSRYTMTTAIISPQWNPFSDYMQTPQEELKSKNVFRNLLCSSHNLYQKFGKTTSL
jgi:hypothetical protein